ncbi:SMP-30/gluconolactonase/LRE family protein [Devosia sp.]|uniref:SMP-30/gluconolactonase/LRE family protein n=1 Tax=Devosia sp. TaxID=1871048 RepID=UPI003A8D71C7
MTGIYESFEKEYASLIQGSAKLETLYEGCRWAEGPCWFGDANQLVWSDIPNNRMLRWTPDGHVSEFRSPSNYVNGNTRDREGRLVSCSHGGRNVVRTEHDGSITVLADSYEGKKLNAPNDVVVKSDGTIWFTDPGYGIMSDYEGYKGEFEQAGQYVFCIDPATGDLKVVTDDFIRPNGLAFSPDEKLLYVADSATESTGGERRNIRVFDVGSDNALSNLRDYYTMETGVPDGFRLDTNGNVWTSAPDGVHILTPSGVVLGKILTPDTVANVEFGGPRHNRLFICATQRLMSIYVAANGCARP